MSTVNRIDELISQGRIDDLRAYLSLYATKGELLYAYKAMFRGTWAEITSISMRQIRKRIRTYATLKAITG